MPRFSIYGLGQYTNQEIWENLELPDDVDSADVIGNIYAQCGELPLVYANGDMMKYLIGVWSRKNLVNWTRMFQALTEEYNPLHNYDRHESWNDSGGSSVDGSVQTDVAGFNDGTNLTPREKATQSAINGHAKRHQRPVQQPHRSCLRKYRHRHFRRYDRRRTRRPYQEHNRGHHHRQLHA